MSHVMFFDTSSPNFWYVLNFFWPKYTNPETPENISRCPWLIYKHKKELKIYTKIQILKALYLVGSVMGVWISNSCDVFRYELRLGSPDSWSVLDFLNFSVNLERQFEVTDDFFWFWSLMLTSLRLLESNSSSFFLLVEPLKVFLAAERRSKRPKEK